MKRLHVAMVTLGLLILSACGKNPSEEFKQYLTVDFPMLVKEENKWATINYAEYVQRGQMTLQEAKIKMAEQVNLCKDQGKKIESFGYKTSPAIDLKQLMLDINKLSCSRRQDLLDMISLNDPIQTDRLVKQIIERDTLINEIKERHIKIIKDNCEKFDCKGYPNISQ